MTDETATKPAENADLEAQVEDLLERIEGVTKEDLPEVVFQHIRTRRNLVTIYAMTDGEPISIPEYMVAAAMLKTLDDGSFMFTKKASAAPEYKLGTVKCFLHPDKL